MNTYLLLKATCMYYSAFKTVSFNKLLRLCNSWKHNSLFHLKLDFPKAQHVSLLPGRERQFHTPKSTTGYAREHPWYVLYV